MLYQKPQMEIVKFEMQEIVRTSGYADDTPLGDYNDGNDIVGDSNNPWQE